MASSEVAPSERASAQPSGAESTGRRLADPELSGRLLRASPLGVLVLAAALAWGLAVGRPGVGAAPSPEPPPAVPVVDVQPQDLSVTIRTHGTLAPWTELELAFEVGGRIAAISPRLAAGERFEAGEVLVEIDPVDVAGRLERARALVDRARAEARLAEERAARLRRLADREAASRAALDEAVQQAAMARAELRHAAADRDQARRDLERTEVRAPFAGRVRSRQVEVGQIVSPGRVLAEIYATHRAEVRLPVPVRELDFLDLPGDSADAAEGSDAPRVRLRAEGGGATTLRWGRAGWSAPRASSTGERAPWISSPASTTPRARSPDPTASR